MQTNNPFDAILLRLEQLQTTLNKISDQTNKPFLAPMADQNRLIDLPEAAVIMRKPVGTVRHYIHHRNLPATKIGKSYLIKLSELMLWVEDFSKAGSSNPDLMQGMLENRKKYSKH